MDLFVYKSGNIRLAERVVWVLRVMKDMGGGACMLLSPELAHSASPGPASPGKISCGDQGISLPQGTNAAPAPPPPENNAAMHG